MYLILPDMPIGRKKLTVSLSIAVWNLIVSIDCDQYDCLYCFADGVDMLNNGESL